MSLTDRLDALLAEQLNRLTVGRFKLPSPVDLDEATRRVERRYSRGEGTLVTRDRINAAVETLSLHGADSLNSRELFVLAYGLAQPVPALRGRPTVADRALIKGLLVRYVTLAQEGKMRGAVWRGLFHSYLQTPRGEVADALRKLMSETWPALKGVIRGFPTWLETLERHLGLLGEQPCVPYLTGLLEGRRELLDDLLVAMPPPAPSWFWDELVDAIVAQLQQIDDDLYRARIPLFLGLSEQPQLQVRRDRILASVLDRHARTRARERDERLVAYALEHWKSPQLAASNLWSQVEPGTKRMVCGWLALEDLEDFYRLCQDDRQVDERRLKYWLRFKGQIGFSQIVLGNALFWSRDADIRHFRERKKGRLAHLTSGPGENNAILMQIGEWLFVEFSAKGNACYPYVVKQLPFERGSTAYSLSDLKNPQATQASKAHRLVHMSAWESEFDAALRNWGIVPDVGGGVPRARAVTASPSASARPVLAVNKADETWTHELPDAVVHTIRRTGARVEDHRAKGGSLWVILERDSPTLGLALRAVGFKYRDGRGYHRQ